MSASVTALLVWCQPLVAAAQLPQGKVPILNTPVLHALSSHGPRLLTIGLIAVTAYCAVLVSNRIFGLLDRRRLTIPGFPVAWAKPTAFVLNMALVGVALITILPYLPWVNTLAFQGVSLFFSVLFALGSVTMMSNIVGGMTLMYGRSFAVGDRITIADLTGDVIEQTLLVTRLRTLRNQVITVPNSILAASQITHVGHSRWSDETQPLVIHATIKIGYQTPWRQVHTALIEAAQQTSEILETPDPFVMQTALDEAYVRYEIKAYTAQPLLAAEIQSELHQNIQDICNEAGIELVAPAYSAMRDGNDPAMPEEYFSIKDIKPGARAGFSRQWFGALTTQNSADEESFEAADEAVDEEELELEAEFEAEEAEFEAETEFTSELEDTADAEVDDEFEVEAEFSLEAAADDDGEVDDEEAELDQENELEEEQVLVGV
ncbi:mechanosensitive ion channel [filamentous cyanobacterium LEGE 11480]|uniref:Mechanosensitive ion channel n=1 Tax=Romeriopsis navalis LEGE 11480 TaxID=2777977 RepID=A0A928VTX4_9CYAN|nr:mechanosensitive ion channel family protein [Romeriopsis navalis]MBE9031989.1 mechanosensitive ion channel [Romeriopsis navalis LEGE 11480]